MTRTLCPHCQLPLRTCLCALLRRVEHRVPVEVLQHPAEALHAKGTLRLLSRCLAQCRVQVGIDFSAPPDWLDGGSALLYPPSAGPSLPATATPPRRLIVLDASWRHSRLLLHRNPWLAALPRYALQSPPASRYASLRKAQAPGQLSTLEAVGCALAALEQRPDINTQLLAVLQDWLALQARQRSAGSASAG